MPHPMSVRLDLQARRIRPLNREVGVGGKLTASQDNGSANGEDDCISGVGIGDCLTQGAGAPVAQITHGQGSRADATRPHGKRDYPEPEVSCVHVPSSVLPSAARRRHTMSSTVLRSDHYTGFTCIDAPKRLLVALGAAIATAAQ